MGGSRRQWGWHELRPDWAEQLVADAGVGRGDLVLDIGAGTGALTAPLLTSGARVVAVEWHAGRAAALRERFRSTPRLVVVHADAADLRLPRRPFVVVASPPYSIASPLIRRLLHPGSRLLSARLVVQDQFARRWASPSAPGAARWARSHAASLGPVVPRHAFRPPPRVPSRVLRLERRC